MGVRIVLIPNNTILQIHGKINKKISLQHKGFICRNQLPCILINPQGRKAFLNTGGLSCLNLKKKKKKSPLGCQAQTLRLDFQRVLIKEPPHNKTKAHFCTRYKNRVFANDEHIPYTNNGNDFLHENSARNKPFAVSLEGHVGSIFSNIF